jgi:hypothetical protein
MYVSSRGVIRATMAAACLLGLSASLPPARAADFNQPAINATLAFSPTNLGDGQYTNLCALNMNKAPVTVNFVIQTPGLGTAPLQTTIQPGQLACGPQFSVFRNANAQLSDLQLRASIELLSPDDCSQASEYPGKVPADRFARNRRRCDRGISILRDIYGPDPS